MAHSAEPIMQDASGTGKPAAYLPFRTFMTAIESFEHGIPKQIDRTIWRSQSGIVQGQIMIALRFLGLVDDTDKPTVALHRFVDGKNNRPELVRALLHHAYRDLVDRDLTKMTPKMLDEAMEQYSVTGDTKKKAVRFFLQAAKFAEMPMHPLLLGQTRNSSGPRRRRRTREQDNTVVEIPMSPLETMTSQQGSVKSIALRSGGKLTLVVTVDVFSMSPEDRTFVFGLIDELQKYEKGEAS
jgi:hypothetical protein